VLLADDHTIVAQGLAGLLGDEFDLVGTVSDGAQLLERARALRPDVIVADIAMPVLSGLDALRQLRAEGIDCKVVFLTMHADAQLAVEALRAGAVGYVLKHAAGEELIRALGEVLEGRIYMTPLLNGGGPQPQEPAGGRLTPRQRDVLRLVVAGRRMKEIAKALHVSRRTVETHKYAMMNTLGVQTTAELIRYALERGLDARC
jgi:DNA-binding NarL/FixJ family response regulator